MRLLHGWSRIGTSTVLIYLVRNIIHKTYKESAMNATNKKGNISMNLRIGPYAATIGFFRTSKNRILLAFAMVAMLVLGVWAATCPTCGGTGMLSCRRCGGTGTVSVMVPGLFGPMPSVVSCPLCVQQGRPSVIRCNTCGGTGQVGQSSPSFTGHRPCIQCPCTNFTWDGSPGYGRCTCGHVH